MCGRARLSTDWETIKQAMHLGSGTPALTLRPCWNIAPTRDMLIVAPRKGAGRAARLAHWGLIPGWAAEAKAIGATFNAKCETVGEKATFRDAWAKKRRCLVVVDGYYEWRKTDKAPFTIARTDGKPMALAGLWDRWGKTEGDFVYSCTVITVPAGPGMDSLHERAPLILGEPDWPLWLGETAGDPRALMQPVSDAGLDRWEVGRAVGNVRNDGPELAEPAQRARPDNPRKLEPMFSALSARGSGAR